MTKLVHGEFMDMTWYELPIAPHLRRAYCVPEQIKVFTVFAPKGSFLYHTVENDALSHPERITFITRDMGFIPFDYDLLPDKFVVFNKITVDESWINKWVKNNIQIPDELEISFEYNRDKKLFVVAKTLKNNKITRVKKKMADNIPIKEALEEHIPYFLKNCPKPEGEAPEFVCGPHVAKIIETASAVASAEINEWLEKLRNNKPPYFVGSLKLPGIMFGDEALLEFTLSKDTRSNIITSEIRLVGGHIIKDDNKGTDIEILGNQIPETIINDLKGRSLYNLIGLEWVKDLTIKLVRFNDDRKDYINLRVHGNCEPLNVPTGYEWTDEKCKEIIREAGISGDKDKSFKIWEEVDEALIPIFKTMNLEQVASILALMKANDQIYLAKYGFPEWSIKRYGNMLLSEHRPKMKYDKFLDEILGK